MNLGPASPVITNNISNVFIDLHMQKYFYLMFLDGTRCKIAKAY